MHKVKAAILCALALAVIIILCTWLQHTDYREENYPPENPALRKNRQPIGQHRKKGDKIDNINTFKQDKAIPVPLKNVSQKRTIFDHLILKPGPGASPYVQFLTNNDTFILNGILPDANIKNEFVNTARSIFGKNRVVDNFHICKRVARVEWLKSVCFFLKILADNSVENGGFECVGSIAVITGFVRDQETKTKIGHAAEKLLGSAIVVNNHLIIRNDSVTKF